MVHLYQNSEKDNMLNKRVLLIPDAYLGDFSGAYVSQIAKKLLLELGCTVAVYSDEVTEDKVEEDGTKLYYRYPCNFTANWFQGKHKKQSGGHGQYGHVKMKFEPSGDLEVPYVFEQCVVGGAVPKNYFPAVEKGIAEAVLKGPLAAYPVIGVKAVLYDGSYHPVDSSEMAFKVAAKQAFKKGFLDAKPVLLEPIASVKIITPEEYTGEIMGDLNKRRGRVMNMNAENGYQEIDADLPYLELYGYNTQLRSMTSGSGTFSYEFARYEQAPEDVAAREIEERAGKVVETEE